MDYINTYYIIGTTASVVGLPIALYQIFKVKVASEAAKEASEKTRDRFTELLFAMDIPKAAKTVQEIQQYNRNKKLELAHLRLQDLGAHLAQIKNNKRFETLIDQAICGGFISDILIGQQNIEKELSLKSNSLNIVTLNNKLDKILHYLLELDTNVRNNGGKYD